MAQRQDEFGEDEVVRYLKAVLAEPPIEVLAVLQDMRESTIDEEVSVQEIFQRVLEAMIAARQR